MRLTLQELGLNAKEIDIYLTLLEMGKVSASVIGYRTKIPASTVHYVCKKLNEKGLVYFTKEQHSICYEAEAPDKILYLYQQQEEELKRKKVRAFKMVSELKSKMYPENSLPKINLYQNFEDMKIVFEDMIRSKKTICSFQNADIEDGEIQNYFHQKYIPKLAKENIHIKAIFKAEPINKLSDKKSKHHFFESRFLSNNNLPFEVEVYIYEGKVAFMSYKKNHTFAVVMDHLAIKNFMQFLFDFYWKMAG